jgi:CheY-like chemotaxis protein
VVELLERCGLAVQRVPDAIGAVELIWRQPFDLLIADHPLPDVSMEDLLATFRDAAGPNRRAGLVLLTDQPGLESARRLVGRGVNRVVGQADSDGELMCAVVDLLGVPARIAVRAIVQVDASARYGGVHTLLRTANLSQTGALLVGGKELPVGAEVGFELHLPETGGQVTGRARVVRHTDPTRERVDGVALQFVEIHRDGLELIAAFVERRR